MYSSLGMWYFSCILIITGNMPTGFKQAFCRPFCTKVISNTKYHHKRDPHVKGVFTHVLGF